MSFAVLSVFGLTGVGAVGKSPVGMVVAALPESCTVGLRPRASLTSAAQLGRSRDPLALAKGDGSGGELGCDPIPASSTPPLSTLSTPSSLSRGDTSSAVFQFMGVLFDLWLSWGGLGRGCGGGSSGFSLNRDGR